MFEFFRDLYDKVYQILTGGEEESEIYSWFGDEDEDYLWSPDLPGIDYDEIELEEIQEYLIDEPYGESTNNIFTDLESLLNYLSDISPTVLGVYLTEAGEYLVFRVYTEKE